MVDSSGGNGFTQPRPYHISPKPSGAVSQAGERKIHIHIEGDPHRLLRLRCAEPDLTIQDCVVRFLDENLRDGTPIAAARTGKDQREKGAK